MVDYITPKKEQKYLMYDSNNSLPSSNLPQNFIQNVPQKKLDKKISWIIGVIFMLVAVIITGLFFIAHAKKEENQNINYLELPSSYSKNFSVNSIEECLKLESINNSCINVFKNIEIEKICQEMGTNSLKDECFRNAASINIKPYLCNLINLEENKQECLKNTQVINYFPDYSI